MKRTKEIDVWVELPSILDAIKNRVAFGNDMSAFKKNCSGNACKAKLIIELPEKKIEITESQFVSLLDQYTDNPDVSYKDFLSSLGF